MESSSRNHRDSAEEGESSVSVAAVQAQSEPPLSPDLPSAGDDGVGDDAGAADDTLARSSDVLARGLSSMLSSVIKDFDYRAGETLSSQDKLSSAIDRLTRELDQLLEDAPLPFILQHAAKISSVSKRVSSLNSLLKSIQGRIDNVDRLLSIGTTHGNPECIVAPLSYNGKVVSEKHCVC